MIPPLVGEVRWGYGLPTSLLLRQPPLTCLPAGRLPLQGGKPFHVRPEGFEPPTVWLRANCSTS